MTKATRSGRPGRSLADLIAPDGQDHNSALPPGAPEINAAASGRGMAAQQSTVDGGKPVTYFVTSADRKMMRQVALDTEMSIHEISREAMSEWLEKRGLRALEPQAANRQSPGRKRN